MRKIKPIQNISSIESEEFVRRVELVRQDIYGLYFTGASKDGSLKVPFIRVINRILLLLQQPVSFIFYQKNGNRLVRLEGFIHTDKRHQKDLYLDSTEERYNLSEENSIEFFQIYGSKYYVKAAWIKDNEDQNTVGGNGLTYTHVFLKRRKSRVIKGYEAYLTHCIAEIFNIDKHLFSGKTAFKSAFRKAVENGIEDLHQVCSTNNRKNPDRLLLEKKGGCLSGVNYLMSDEQRKLFDDEIFSDIYQQSKPSFELLDSMHVSKGKNQTSIPNTFLMVRSFSRIELRQKGEQNKFAYDARFCFPKLQLDDAASALLEDPDIHFTPLRDKYFAVETLELEADVKSEIIEINGDNEKLCEYIFEVMTTPVSKTTQSISDSVYSGLVHLKNPFCFGGFNRIGDDQKDPNSDEVYRDKKRLVLVNYFFQMMLPVPKGEKRKVLMLLLPIFVSGRVVGILGHIIKNSALREQAFNDTARWNTMYTFYDSFYTKISDSIRTKMMDNYLNRFFEKDSSDGLKNALIDLITKQVAIGKANELISQYCARKKYLTRFYPFPSFNLKLRKMRNDDTVTGFNLFLSYIVDVEVGEHNQFFDVLISTSDRSSEEILKKEFETRLKELLTTAQTEILIMLHTFKQIETKPDQEETKPDQKKHIN